MERKKKKVKEMKNAKLFLAINSNSSVKNLNPKQK